MTEPSVDEPQRSLRLGGTQRQLLDSPVAELADVQFVFTPAIDRVDEPELLDLFACSAEPADDLAIEVDFVDRRILHPVGIAGVCDVRVLARPGRDADGR